jgi:hypothetical protein
MHTQSDTDGGSFCFQLLGFQSAKNTTKAPHQQQGKRWKKQMPKRKILILFKTSMMSLY